jgi:hypothetical protein
MLAGIETVRRLWRGESMPARNPMVASIEVRTLPRPVQKDLPMWLTAAGNPETFRQAGELGCNVLTHLLGQSVEDVAEKVRIYHAAWREAGHPGQGRVTLMLHTFVGQDEEKVRETVREPMKAYLRSSVDLIRQAAWTFPTFVQGGAAKGGGSGGALDLGTLSDEEMDALLEHAFARYYHSSGLFGTPESCLEMVGRLQCIGIDEIACLIDFGVPAETVLDHLRDLKELMRRAAESGVPLPEASVAEELTRHGVTHFQCTPSMAKMLAADGAARSALSRLKALLVGGEALSVGLATELRALVPGSLLNMYGPTETTIWSSTAELERIGTFVPLGTPIANTRLHVLTPDGRECPSLVAGELHIAGAGVAAGYLGRPELTAERFVGDPFGPGEGGLLYRTGDLVRRHPDGAIEFLGRIDHQVKIRGHRIELGEIESALERQPDVREAVVVSCDEGSDDHRLVGYVTPRTGTPPDPDRLRRKLAERLPEIMVPSAIMVLPALPLTPNGKVDRRALPVRAPAATQGPVAAAAAAPESSLEKAIAAIWCDVLKVPSVGTTDNFFDLGGHSLLVVQVQRRMREELGQEIGITDMFRYTTIRALAAHLAGTGKDSAVEQGLDRANIRKAMLLRRQQSLVPTASI